MRLPIFFAFVTPALLFAQAEPNYGGPSVLSRGLLPSMAANNPVVRFRPFISINGLCDTGLTPIRVDASGKIPNANLCGVEASAGLYGSHRWRRTMLGLTYTGTYRHYSQSSYYDGSDQGLSLGLSERLSKRLQFNLRVQAGEFSRNYTTPVAPGIVDTSSVPIPNSQLFDNRVEYGSTGADLAVRLSSRWSFNIGGDAVLERYRSVLLYGVTQTGVHSDVAYRYSRFGTIGAAYAFEHFSFTKGFGASDVHAASIVWSIRLSHTWELAARGGVGRVESLGLQVVSVDPIVAVITGQSFGVTAAYHLNYVPDVSMSLSHMFQYSNLQFGYSRGTTPGNGVYLTSAQESASVGYRYSGLQHWSLDASAGYTSLRPLVQSLSNYHGYSGGVGVARTLRGGVQLVMRTEWRRFDNGGTFFRRNSARATLGFAWSPGDIPLSLW